MNKLHIALYCSVIFLALSFVWPNIANAVYGDTIILPQNSAVTVNFISSDAVYDNSFGLWSPNRSLLGSGYSTGFGAQFNLGNFNQGTELIFYIDNGQGQIWKTGPASRNSDRVPHANVTRINAQQWQVAFEDRNGGGDRDYDDLIISVITTASCFSNAIQKCVGNSLYWYDSCGNQQGLSQTCQYGCSNGACLQNTCVSNYNKKCVGSSLYWYDSCGNQQGLSQTCQYGCSNGACLQNTCISHYSKKCVGNSIYWFDSCGNQQGLSQTCSYGCTGSGSYCSCAVNPNSYNSYNNYNYYGNNALGCYSIYCGYNNYNSGYNNYSNSYNNQNYYNNGYYSNYYPNNYWGYYY